MYLNGRYVVLWFLFVCLFASLFFIKEPHLLFNLKSIENLKHDQIKPALMGESINYMYMKNTR